MFLDDLPYEVKLLILGQMRLGDISKVGQTCRVLHSATEDEFLWSSLINRDFHLPVEIMRSIREIKQLSEANYSYKQLYQELYRGCDGVSADDVYMKYLMQFAPQMLAESFAAQSLDLFVKIPREEWLNQDNRACAMKMLAIGRHNNVANYFINFLLMRTSPQLFVDNIGTLPEHRQQEYAQKIVTEFRIRMELVIGLIKACCDRGDYETGVAIWSSLQSHLFHPLMTQYVSLSPQRQDTWKQLNDLFCFSGNSKNLRHVIQVNAKAIPFCGQYFTDLIFAICHGDAATAKIMLGIQERQHSVAARSDKTHFPKALSTINEVVAKLPRNLVGEVVDDGERVSSMHLRKCFNMVERSTQEQETYAAVARMFNQ